MHENPDHIEQPPLESHAPHHEGDPGANAQFPGTEPIDGATADDAPSAPRERKPNWFQKRKLKSQATEGSVETRSPGLPWDLRLKIAVVASFLILVSALILNRNYGTKSSKTLPVATLKSGSSDSPQPAKTETPEGDASAKDPSSEPSVASEELPKLPSDGDEIQTTGGDLVASNTPPPTEIGSDLPKVELPPDLPSPVEETPRETPPPLEVGKPPSDPATSTPPSIPPDLTVLPAPAASEVPLPPSDPTPITTKPDPDPTVPPAEPMPDPSLPPTVVTPSDTPPLMDLGSTGPKDAAPAPEPPAQVAPSSPTDPIVTPDEPKAVTPLNLTTPPPADAVDPVASMPVATFSIPNAGAKSAADVMAAAKSQTLEPETEKPEQVGTKSASSEFEPIAHVVRRGENFWTIARYHYGSGRFYKALWDANRDQAKTPEDLYVGTELRIPPIESLNRSLIEPAPRARETAKAGSSTGSGKGSQDTRARRASNPTEDEGLIMLPSADPANGLVDEIKPPTRSSKTARSLEVPSRTRVVRKHETLRSIARDELGDANREGDIAKLNQDLADPDDGMLRVRVGMTLKLPDETRRQ